MRTNVPHIFAIGGIVGQPIPAHKAVYEVYGAAEVIAVGQSIGMAAEVAHWSGTDVPPVKK